MEVVIQYKYSDSAPPAAKPAAESFPRNIPRKWPKTVPAAIMNTRSAPLSSAHPTNLPTPLLSQWPPIRQEPSSLFIYGGSGLGKTHLLYAISNEITKNNPNANAIYIKGEDFTNELIEAIKSETTIAFHNKYRQADILLVDDIQFIGGKDPDPGGVFPHLRYPLSRQASRSCWRADRPPKEIHTAGGAAAHPV